MANGREPFPAALAVWEPQTRPSDPNAGVAPRTLEARSSHRTIDNIGEQAARTQQGRVGEPGRRAAVDASFWLEPRQGAEERQTHDDGDDAHDPGEYWCPLEQQSAQAAERAPKETKTTL